MKQDLSSQFPTTTKKQWEEEALKKAKVNKQEWLWQPEENITISPFFNKEDLNTDIDVMTYQNIFLSKNKDGQISRRWDNCCYIGVINFIESNQKALEALKNGANCIEFDLSAYIYQDIEWELLLKDIRLENYPIHFVIKDHLTDTVKSYLDYIQSKLSINHFDLQGSFRTIFPDIEDISKAIRLTQNIQNLKVNSIYIGNNNKVSERFTTGLSLLAERINTLTGTYGCAIDEVFNNTVFITYVGNNYFFEIAGLRAFRALFYKIFTLYGVSYAQPSDLEIHIRTTVETSKDTEIHQNLITNTTQAMSAIIGGCDRLTVMPHVWGQEEVTPLTERIARNVSNILKEEAHFDKVVDPAAGSYYVESLTNRIGKIIWDKFREKC